MFRYLQVSDEHFLMVPDVSGEHIIGFLWCLQYHMTSAISRSMQMLSGRQRQEFRRSLDLMLDFQHHAGSRSNSLADMFRCLQVSREHSANNIEYCRRRHI